MRVAVLVPCRNEGLVISRKLANLARIAWPAADEAHVVVVVDDGSEDDTSERAREAARLFASRADVLVRVVANEVRPGKPGAIQQGILEIGDRVDLVVLTDADVVVSDDALCELVRAFAADAGLALACGAQHFVQDLAPDGTARARDLGLLRPAAGWYDRASAFVRRLESRFGRLFSVHGQWLAWRAAPPLVPGLGIAADDLDLMLQVRAREEGPRDVRMIAAARFHEQKTPPGERADEQALRRARAYLQVLRASRPRGSALDRAQWLFYRFVPPNAPLVAVMTVASALGGAWLLDARFALGMAICCALFLASPAGRRLVRLLATIARASALEARARLPERWEMAR